MKEESIPKLILSFSVTTLAALLFNSLYTVTDALFVSHAVGDNAMGGISLILPFSILQSAIASAVGSGAASIVSRALGEGNGKKAGNATYNAMLTFYVSAVLITVVGFLTMEPMLNLLGVTDELYLAAKQYYSIILAGNIFSTGFSSIIRAEGKMTYALLIWVIPVSVNIILDALFVLVFGWGVVGSAAATVICQMTSASMSVLFFTRFTTQSFAERRFSIKLVGRIVLIGLPSIIQMGSLSLLTLIVNNTLSAVAGTDGVNSFAYISKIITFAVIPVTALSQALAPIAGYNYGSGEKDRVRGALRFCSLVSLVYSLLALLAINVFASPFVRVFTESENMIKLASEGLRYVSFSLPFSFLTPLVAVLFQAKGKKIVPFVLYCIVPVSASILMAVLAKRFALSGVWAAYVAANAISSLASLAVLLYSKAKEK